MGGKARIGKHLAQVMHHHADQHNIYIEPFVGAGSVLAQMAPHFEEVIASDIHEDLILMWRALQSGWTPPHAISREEYEHLRHSPPSPLRGFAGFACSFGGKWFGGYVDNRVYPKTATDNGGNMNTVRSARNSLLKKLPVVPDVSFLHMSYSDIEPCQGMLVYCDPPYRGTQTFTGLPPFDSDLFWHTMREWITTGAQVFVSEYVAPSDWRAIYCRSVNRDLIITKGSARPKAEEALFVHESQLRETVHGQG